MEYSASAFFGLFGFFLDFWLVFMVNFPWDKRQRAFQRAIRQVRVRAQLTQVELSRRLAKSQSHVSKYENGERRLDYLETREVCTHCGVTIAAFDSLLLREVRRKKV